MADDIFLSPEEQDERAKQWLKDNGMAIVVGVALGFGAIFGYNQYKDSLVNNAEQASALFSVAIERVNDSKNADISAQVDKLKAEYANSSYAAKATLISASQKTVINDFSGAFSELQWVVDNAPESGLVHTARLRQAKIKLSEGDLDSARTLATPVSFDGFTSHYNEILGDLELKAGNSNAARGYYETAIESLNDTDAAYSQILNLKLNRLPAAVMLSSKSISIKYEHDNEK